MTVNQQREAELVTRPLRRFEGRLFAEGGCLFLVVHVDEAEQSAQVTCRFGEDTEILEMPLADVARRVSSAHTLILDNLNGPTAERRILELQDGWYFAAREGRIGPFASRQEAGRALARHVLSMQSADGGRRDPRSAVAHRPPVALPSSAVQANSTMG